MRQLAVCDDVSVARSKGTLVSRRALADTILGMTIYFILCRIVLTVFVFFPSFGAVVKLGQAVTGAIASLACTLDHCHLPGCSEYSIISRKTVEIGLGLYSEPVSNCYNYVR